MLFAAGDGELGPGFFIIKATAQGSDMSRTRVLTSLHDDAGHFSRLHGWSLLMWAEKKLVNGTLVASADVKRPYLIHAESLAVVTVQTKAWMDSSAACMWAELCLHPWLQRNGRLPAVLVWDNCGSHNTEVVSAVLSSLDPPVFVHNLPPNCTDVLQVMDLVVNGPVKKRLREVLCNVRGIVVRSVSEV
jgi:hypothetical protein